MGVKLKNIEEAIKQKVNTEKIGNHINLLFSKCGSAFWFPRYWEKTRKWKHQERLLFNLCFNLYYKYIEFCTVSVANPNSPCKFTSEKCYYIIKNNFLHALKSRKIPPSFIFIYWKDQEGTIFQSATSTNQLKNEILEVFYFIKFREPVYFTGNCIHSCLIVRI